MVTPGIMLGLTGHFMQNDPAMKLWKAASLALWLRQANYLDSPASFSSPSKIPWNPYSRDLSQGNFKLSDERSHMSALEKKERGRSSAIPLRPLFLFCPE
jgi:hypothetical protein